jgi:hypothetical protein
MRLGWAQSETPSLKDGIAVHTKVLEVDHPVVDSPSLVGDRSEATLQVTRGSIPGHPGVTRIIMGFDRHNPRSSLIEGQNCVLRFTQEGGFLGYDMLETPPVAGGPRD